MMAKCRSCQARVEWAITEGGKNMPIDPVPDSRGNLIKTGAVVGGKPEVHTITSRDELKPGTVKFTSHFATCPNASSHRSR
jgi:hypothetical protein